MRPWTESVVAAGEAIRCVYVLTRSSVLVCTLALAGCASFSGYPDKVSQAPPKSIDEDAYYKATDAALRQGIRNEYIFNRIGALDDKYDGFTKALTSESNSVSLTSDLSLIAIGAAGTLTKSTATKTALAAATTVVAGTSASINKDLFYQKTVPAVIAQMDADRAEVLATIYTGVKENTTDYPLEAAKNALRQYEKAGSIPSAITKLTTASQNQATDNKAKADAALTGTYTVDDAGQKLVSFVKPGGTRNTTNAKRLEKWIADNKIDQQPSVTSFTYMDKYGADRVKAVKDLGL